MNEMGIEPVLILNDEGGVLTIDASVDPARLSIFFSKSKKFLFFKIDAKALFSKLNFCQEEFQVPGQDKLTFVPEKSLDGEEEIAIHINPDVLGKSPDLDLALVSLYDLKEALYYFLG